MEEGLMADAEQGLQELLNRFLSPPITKGLMKRLRERLGLNELNGTVPPALLESLERASKPFLSMEEHRSLSLELSTLNKTSLLERHIMVYREDDIVVTRNEAHRMSMSLGGSSFSAQRASTVTSELARNIVNYTTGGSIALGPIYAPKTRLLICSQDSGPGIKGLDEILAGHYKSRSGMGLGLSGVKRISAYFRIQTSSAGTRIEAEVEL
jgi:serine/threonine-protein kinase RsbT